MISRRDSTVGSMSGSGCGLSDRGAAAHDGEHVRVALPTAKPLLMVADADLFLQETPYCFRFSVLKTCWFAVPRSDRSGLARGCAP
jgi:hypothetical protein